MWAASRNWYKFPVDVWITDYIKCKLLIWGLRAPEYAHKNGSSSEEYMIGSDASEMCMTRSNLSQRYVDLKMERSDAVGHDRIHSQGGLLFLLGFLCNLH